MPELFVALMESILILPALLQHLYSRLSIYTNLIMLAALILASRNRNQPYCRG